MQGDYLQVKAGPLNPADRPGLECTKKSYYGSCVNVNNKEHSWSFLRTHRKGKSAPWRIFDQWSTFCTLNNLQVPTGDAIRRAICVAAVTQVSHTTHTAASIQICPYGWVGERWVDEERGFTKKNNLIQMISHRWTRRVRSPTSVKWNGCTGIRPLVTLNKRIKLEFQKRVQTEEFNSKILNRRF